MSVYTKFQQGDMVNYVGLTFQTELTKEGKRLVGYVHATVANEEDTYVVEFPETKNEDSYVMHARSLQTHRPKQKEAGPEVAPRRRKRDDDLV